MERRSKLFISSRYSMEINIFRANVVPVSVSNGIGRSFVVGTVLTTMPQD